jgi:hypothetical protein
MHFNDYYIFYSLYSHRHVSTAIAAIFRAMLLQEYKGTNVVSCHRHSIMIKNYVKETQLTTFVPLYSCNNITLKMAAIAAETCR